MYFSLISEEKGAQLVIDAAKALPACPFVFYGRIDPEYEAKFASELERMPNVEYRGIFDSVAGGCSQRAQSVRHPSLPNDVSS